MAMHADITMREGKGIVAIEGALSEASVDAFREKVQEWMKVNAGTKNVVIDAAKMEFIDSAGLGVLIALLKRASENGGNIRIAGLQAKSRVIFEITRAFKIFEIFDTVEEALRADA
ncbi:MAG: STAS domain-containing protein [Kiritimatiellaceae bacterium]|nr:STAS domain-containing protein [Kiritimatiellaceae bacterium]